MARLTAVVLGSAAGGGYPQGNCRCSLCRMAWDGDARVTPRTQTSLAVSGDGKVWTLINATPDSRAQILAQPVLHPRGAERGSPIGAVVLTGAEIDQTAGLLNLRERTRFRLVATAETLAALDENPMFEALGRDCIVRETATPNAQFELPGGLTAELFAVPGKTPLYKEDKVQELGAAPGGNVGVELRAGGARLAFVPGAAALDAPLVERLARADALLFDSTLFTDDEMIAAGVGEKTGRRMGHMPIAGPEGSLAALAGLTNRRIYIHINNTNPLLAEGSPERRQVETAGWEVAYDGLRIEL
jgi:pyrroloquinoline quinone biosynthesis protein B